MILWTGLAVSGIWEACARSFTHKSDASLLTAEMELSIEAFIFPFHSFFGCSDGLVFCCPTVDIEGPQVDALFYSSCGFTTTRFCSKQ